MARYLRRAHLPAAAVVTGRVQRAPWVPLARPVLKSATVDARRKTPALPVAIPKAGEKKPVPDASVHLDAIRGTAALLVFLGHGRTVFLKSGLHDAIAGGAVKAGASAAAAAVDSTGPALGATARHTNIGHQSVIVFFVLSGYFVGGSVLRGFRKGSFTWGSYMFQRLTRLWMALIPALLLGLVLDLVGTHFIPGHGNLYSGPAGQLEVAPGFATSLSVKVFAGNVFFLQGLICRVLGTNVSLWSLSYEFWYYVFFPLLLTVCLRAKTASIRLISGLLLALAMVFCGWYICANFLLWLLGAGIAALPLTLADRYRRPMTWAAGVVFLGVLVLALVHPMLQLISDFALGAAFCGFLWCLLHARRVTVGEVYRWSAQGLSSMSYTLYLVHMPCFVFLSALLMPEWRPWLVSGKSLGMLAAIYAMVFAVCWAMYFGFERNTEVVRRWASGRARRHFP